MPAAKRKAKVKAPAADAPDPRVLALLDALRADRKLAPIVRDLEARRAAGGRAFGSNGLKVNGKLFALFTQGTLVVKLTRSRVDELVAAETGERFDPGHGRLMKEWLTVTDQRARWIDLVREAHALGSDLGAHARTRRR